jgi:hypothetical protein
MRDVRSVIRVPGALPRVLGALTAVLLLFLPGLVLGAPAAQAAAGQVQQSVRTDAAAPPSLAISISGMTPRYATKSSTITLTGALANRTGSAVSGITVQAETSATNFSGRSAMTTFTDTGSYPSLLEAAGSGEVTGAVPNGATVRWSVSFPAAGLYDQFGVFPIQVQASTANGAYTAAARTFSVYWAAGSAAAEPTPLQVGWVWPLVDTPQQGACGQTLATSRLAGSVAAGGRLSTLLDAGSTWGQADHLTWDIDPALLSDVSVMTRPYSTLGDADCSGRFQQKPSPAATQWLTELSTATAGQSAFLTPYADVDVAALSHAGLDGSLRSAYQLGDAVAGQILPNTFGTNGTSTGDGSVLRAAWPAGGLADADVLTSLANDGGVSTVILNSDEMQSSTPGGYDNALAKTTSGIGTSMSVLLADSGMTSLLGSASATSSEAGQFAFTQDFLAQTAMISAEAPNLGRSLLIAPPTDWDPAPAEAKALLSMTQDTPWLHSVGLSTLSADAAKLPSESLPAKQVSRDELSATYLDRVKEAANGVSVFTDLLYKPSAPQVSSLEEAVAATESSAWRGTGSAGGWLAVTHLTNYLADSEHKVQIIASNKILLAGNSGETPVSVRNNLGVPVQVKVTASTPAHSQLRVGKFAALLYVPAGKTNTVRMPLHAASIGTTTVQLQLVTQNGSPLAWTAKSLSVEVTRVGRFLLTVIGGALGILILTSVYRLRRKRLARARQRGTADETAEAGGAG